jgi:hypothetical protein
VTPRTIHKQKKKLTRRLKAQPGRRHQSIAMAFDGRRPYCQYKKCPGLNLKKTTERTYRTHYKCEECSVEKGNDVWLCNAVKTINKKKKAIECHVRYHAEKEFVLADSTECSIISDLTDE